MSISRFEFQRWGQDPSENDGSKPPEGENDDMILLQNEDCVLSSIHLKGNLPTYKYIYIYIYIYIFIYLFRYKLYIYVHIYIYLYVFTYIYIYTHTYAFTYAYTYIDMYAHIHIHHIPPPV